MKVSLFILLFSIASWANGQGLGSLNFCDSLDGIWSVNLSNKQWQEDNLNCYEVKTIEKDGTVKSLRTCNQAERNREYIERWIRLDRTTMEIYGQTYQAATKTWSSELVLYRVVSISSTFIKLENDLETKEIGTIETLTYILRRNI